MRLRATTPGEAITSRANASRADTRASSGIRCRVPFCTQNNPESDPVSSCAW
jgi:hypothetical protein